VLALNTRTKRSRSV